VNARAIRLNLNDRRPLLVSLRRRQIWLKSIAVVVTVAFLGLTLQSLAIAANLPSRAPAKAAAPSNEEKLAQALEAIEQRLDHLHTKLSTDDKGAKAETVLRSDINTLDQTTRQGLNEVEKGIKTKTPSQPLLERHTKNIAAYQRAITALSARADQTLKEGLTSGTTNERLSLQALRANITKLDKNTRDGLNHIGRDLKDKKANTAVLNRHKTVAKQYQTDIGNVKAAVDTWATAMADVTRNAKTKPAPTHDTTKDTAALKSLRTELDALDRQAIADFNAIEQHIKDKNLPAIIMQRHREAVATYETEMAAVKANLDAIGSATNDTDRSIRILKARDHLRAKQAKKGPKTKFDPNDLPNKSLQPNPNNKPKLTPNDFVRAGLISNPTVKLAAHGSFRIDRLPAASDPAYLAATTEVTLTDAIRAKAAELNHNPVQIYNWVRNSVEWIPTWGATQDADVTLGSKRGNAMDIASLLIALLRASDIPARYAHGTIEVPEDKFRNWAGGFTDTKAAGDYASSGGIPITGIVTGGRITKFQMEHIWVEAAIDFQPSRGAINKSADSWVSLDASYKQYQNLPGIDAVSVSGIDPNAIAQSFANSGTLNPTEGWVSGLNPAILQNVQTQVSAALQQHIQNSLPNAKVSDVIGGRRIIAHSSSALSTALPYYPGVKVRGATYGALPAALQNSMTFGFGVDFLGEVINPVTLPWPRLNNHKLTLSFKPATAADEQALNSLLPGNVTDEAQLPSSVPAYLIYVVPELSLDGNVIGIGSAMRLGEDLSFVYQVTTAGGIEAPYIYRLPAGSYLNIPVIGGSVSPTINGDLAARLDSVRSTFASDNPALIAALSREDVLGNLFYAGTLAYFGQYFALNHVRGTQQQGRHNLPTGYGSYGYEPNVRTLFGFPRAIEQGGVGVNIRLAFVAQPLDGDAQKWRRLNLESGMLSSALEHSIPELFAPEPIPAEGISAVKALSKANVEGQRIYHLTQTNQAQTLPNLRLDGLSVSEIQAALAVGREVITHTDPVNIPGWRGAGYVILDPTTASGAYKISGGKNGGFQQILDGFVFATAAALGYVDGKIGQHADKAYIFSDQLKYLSKLAKASAALGVLALLVSVIYILKDETLSLSQKIGQIAVEALGFGITTYITAAALSLGFFPVFVAILVAITMTLALALIKAMYFSSLRIRSRIAFV